MYIIKSLATAPLGEQVRVTVVATSIYRSLERSMIEVTTFNDPQQVYMLGPLRWTGPLDEEFTALVTLDGSSTAFDALQTIRELIEDSELVSIDALRDLRSWLETGVMPGPDADDDDDE